VLGAIGRVIFILLVARLTALVLDRLVRELARARVPRRVGVLLVYAGFAALVVVIAALVWPPVVEQLRNLSAALPGTADQAGDTVTRLRQVPDSAGLAIDVRRQLRAALAAVADRVPQSPSSTVHVGITVVRQITCGIISICICTLLDSGRVGRFVARHFPTRSESDSELYVRRARLVHPLVVVFAILAGGEVHGIAGMLSAVPLIPRITETVVSLRPRVTFEGRCAALTGRPDAPSAGDREQPSRPLTRRLRLRPAAPGGSSGRTFPCTRAREVGSLRGVPYGGPHRASTHFFMIANAHRIMYTITSPAYPLGCAGRAS
jgi:predicted PurR-regulated permease PerM